MLGRILDNTIATLAPGWGASRARSRLQMEMLATYAAAEQSRTTRDWRGPTTSADGAYIGDQAAINGRARAAARDDWAASSIVQGYRRHIVGTGIHSRSNARDDQGNPLKDFNQQADRKFKLWCSRPAHCDIERRKTFVEMQGLVVSEFCTVGESIVLKVFDQSNKSINPLRFQVIEPEQLDQTLYKSPLTDNHIRNGIEIGPNGEAVAYWIYVDGHPYEQYAVKSRRFPADQVLHFMRQDRPRQSHGVTRLASVLKKLWHLGMYDQYQIIRARYEAAIGMVIESAPNAAGGLNPFASTIAPTLNSDGTLRTEIQPGMSPVLPPGYTAKFMQPTTPGGTYEPFMYQQLTEAAAGAGLDYATVTRDYSKGSFSSQRQGQIVLNQEIDQLQALLESLILQPIRDEFITLEVLSGRIDAPGFFDSPEETLRYLACDWQAQPKPWIDPANQAAAAKLQIDYRLKSRAAIVGELGDRVEDVFDQIDDEQLYADDLGIGLPEVMPTGDRPARNPNEPIPGNMPDGPMGPDGQANGQGTGDRQASPGQAKPMPFDPNAIKPEAKQTPATGSDKPSPADASGLNGAQITSAAEVVTEVTNGYMAPLVGQKLLEGVGFDEATAKEMIDAATSFKPKSKPEPVGVPA